MTKSTMFRAVIFSAAMIGGLSGRAEADPVRARDMAAIKKYLRADEPQDRPDKTARIWASYLPRTDLILVYIQSGYSCGSGGCDLFLFRGRAPSLRFEKAFGALFRPITVLRTVRYGRPDIGVRGRYQFPEKPFSHQFPLRFDGWRYREYQNVNLSVDGQPIKGHVLICKDDPGIPLF